MLTPLDIQKQEFGVKMRGYNADEVDDFLDLVGADYEKLYRENKELKDKMIVLNKAIEEYKNIENSLRNAEDVKKNANEKAQNIIQEAENKARDKSQEFAQLQTEIDTYKTKIKSFCNVMLEMLEKIE